MFKEITGKIVYKNCHPDGDLLIVDSFNHRYLYLGSDAIQSGMDLRQPLRLVVAYTQVMMSFLLLHPKPQRILLAGLGGGSLLKFLHHHFPEALIDVTEIRADIIETAYRFFQLPHHPNITIHLCDSRDYLNQQLTQAAAYDLMFIDAYDYGGIAPSVANQHFFDLCHHHLDSRGVLVANIWSSNDTRFETLLGHLSTSFDRQILRLPVPERGNVIVLACPYPLNVKQLKQLAPQAQQLETDYHLPFSRYLNDLIKHNPHNWLQRWLLQHPMG